MLAWYWSTQKVGEERHPVIELGGRNRRVNVVHGVC
jgi:hypothetical protein